jgi:hypothetical protein
MSSQHRFLAVILIVAVAALGGCGSGSSRFAGPPVGGFSNASLSGPYAFSLAGTNNFGFFAMAGSFQANGNGTLSSGALDLNSGAGIFTNVPFTGTYTVHANGQGTATLATALQNFNLNFVVISSQRALVIRFDNNATASGTIALQTTAAFSNAALGGTLAFSLAGVDAAGSSFMSAGSINNDGAGSITSGVQDNNDNGAPSTNLPLTGSYAVGSTATGRGTVQLNASLGTLHFTFYVVDANHLMLIGTDNVPALAGEAFRQQGTFSNASLAGPFALTVSGATSTRLPFAGGILLTADGAGNIPSGSEDTNTGGVVTQNIAFTGNYALASSGRGTLTLNSSRGSLNFVFYPTSGGIQALEVDPAIVSSGTAFAQTGPFSNGTVQGNYGFNLGGVSNAGEIDSIAQFSANGTGSLTGAIDINNVGALSSGLALSGSYSVSGNGRGTASLRSSFGTQNLIVYVVSSSRVLFIETDSNLVAVGDFEHQ